MLSLNFYSVRQWAYLYMVLPVFCFLGFYIHSIWGMIFLAFACTAFASFWVRNRKAQKEKDMMLSVKWLIAFAMVAVLWSYLGGQGNLFFQNSDWNYRNAIYRDLVYRDWPVVYPEYNKALVYYISYWLPPAVIAKALAKLLPFLIVGERAFKLANLFLWGWTALGIFLVELLLVTYIKPKQKKDYITILLVLVFFSGLDVIGAAYQHITKGIVYPDNHFEWWAEKMQFSSLTTCLFWVFNQAVIPWIAILCLLQEKTVQDYVLLGMCVFAAGPMPFLGVFVYMMTVAVRRLICFWKEKDLGTYVKKEVFSFSNCCSVMIFVPYILYYVLNEAIAAGVQNPLGITFLCFELLPVDIEFILQVAVFWILEVGLYLIIVHRMYQKNCFYWATVAVTLIAPFIKVGTSIDFVMRASIPAVMLIAAMCMNYLVNGKSDIERKDSARTKLCGVLMGICLYVGAITPLAEITRGFYVAAEHGKLAVLYDSVKTLNRTEEDINFVAYDYAETFAYKYIFLSQK